LTRYGGRILNCRGNEDAWAAEPAGERALCDELDFQLLWRWFLGMSLMEPTFDQSTFSKNRGRLLKHVVAQQFFDEVVRQADALGWLSDEHFTVDRALIEAAASLKSFKSKDQTPSNEPPDDPGDPTINFRGEKRSNATHQSTMTLKLAWPRKGAASNRGWHTWATR
jgi:Transposase domain (DUF772)